MKPYFKEEELKIYIQKYEQQKSEGQKRRQNFYLEKIIKILQDLNIRVIFSKFSKYQQKYNFIQDKNYIQDQIEQLKHQILQQQLQQIDSKKFDPTRQKQYSFFTAIQENIVKYYIQIQVKETNYFYTIPVNQDVENETLFDNMYFLQTQKQNDERKETITHPFVEYVNKDTFKFKTTLRKLIKFINERMNTLRKIEQKSDIKNAPLVIQELQIQMRLFIILANIDSNKEQIYQSLRTFQLKKETMEKDQISQIQHLIQKLVKQNLYQEFPEMPMLMFKFKQYQEQQEQINEIQKYISSNENEENVVQ